MSAQPKVTIGRVETWLRGEGLTYELDEDGDVITGFEDCIVSIIDRGGDFLSVAAVWRGDISPEEEARMRAYIDEHNATKYAPRAVLHPGEDGLELGADMSAVIKEGMSDDQLHDFLHKAFVAVLGFFGSTEEVFAHLVTWTEED